MANRYKRFDLIGGGSQWSIGICNLGMWFPPYPKVSDIGMGQKPQVPYFERINVLIHSYTSYKQTTNGKSLKLTIFNEQTIFCIGHVCHSYVTTYNWAIYSSYLGVLVFTPWLDKHQVGTARVDMTVLSQSTRAPATADCAGSKQSVVEWNKNIYCIWEYYSIISRLKSYCRMMGALADLRFLV